MSKLTGRGSVREWKGGRGKDREKERKWRKWYIIAEEKNS